MLGQGYVTSFWIWDPFRSTEDRHFVLLTTKYGVDENVAVCRRRVAANNMRFSVLGFNTQAPTAVG